MKEFFLAGQKDWKITKQKIDKLNKEEREILIAYTGRRFNYEKSTKND